MFKKLLCCSVILIISILLLNVSYATDIAMSTNVIDPNTIEPPIDDTIYSSDLNALNSDIPNVEDTTLDYEDSVTTTTTDYEDSTDLSISNIINIILISVGIVLILLGIAIIIKLK